MGTDGTFTGSSGICWTQKRGYVPSVPSSVSNGVTSNYGYDPLYELTQVTQGGSTTESYSYDSVGNRLSSSGVPNYSYNSSNELTSNSSGSYSYDANGNTLSDPSGKSYTWDFENRMVSAVVPGTNGGTTTFKYDPFGRRIQNSGPLGTTNYLYDGANGIEEVDSGGNLLARYTQEPRWDGPLSMLRGSVTSYYEQDGLNSVASLTNSSGALAQSYTYDSYGKITASTGTLTNPFQYTGREFDPETQLNFYRARYYDQSSGRFLSKGPKAVCRWECGFLRLRRQQSSQYEGPRRTDSDLGLVVRTELDGRGRSLHTILPRRANITSRGAIPILRACIMTSATTNADEIILVAREIELLA